MGTAEDDRSAAGIAAERMRVPSPKLDERQAKPLLHEVSDKLVSVPQQFL